MGGIDVSSLFVFEGSADSDAKENDDDDDEDQPLVGICTNGEAVDDAESVLGFDDDGDHEVRDCIDDHSGRCRFGGFVGIDTIEEEVEEEEEEVNSGGGVGGVGGNKKRMEDMENKLFWETCLRKGYP